jgi:hypothetical protein
MTQKDIFEGISGDEEEVIETPVEEVKKPEKKKPKRVLSDERKAQLREQLKRGRETSKANRAKKALVRSAEKEIKKKEDNKKIAKAFLNDESSPSDELKQLREEMKAMKEAMKQTKQEPKPEPRKPVLMKEEKNEKIETPKPVTPPPAPTPQRKVFNTKEHKRRKYF